MSSDAATDWIVLLSDYDPEVLPDVVANRFSIPALHLAGAQKKSTTGRYRLTFVMTPARRCCDVMDNPMCLLKDDCYARGHLLASFPFQYVRYRRLDQLDRHFPQQWRQCCQGEGKRPAQRNEVRTNTVSYLRAALRAQDHEIREPSRSPAQAASRRRP